MTMSRNGKLAFLVYFVCLAIYAATAGTRLRAPSHDTHFVYQAKMFLEHRLDLGRVPPSQNDWAEVEYLVLKDGRTVSGCFLRSQPSHFRTLAGKVETIPATDIQSRSKKYYVSFPPFPAVLFLPVVAVAGLATNDVLLTLLLAPLGPMFLFLVLRRLSARGDSQRSEQDDLWLVALFAVGSVYYYSSILGQVWYTAHIVATALCGAFILASMEARAPVLAGCLLGALTLTRPQMGFVGIFFLYEAWRRGRLTLATMVRVGLPVAAFVGVGAWFNMARFGSPTEFGHFYLNVRWTDRIQRYGLFNFAFLSRNLAAAFALTPKLLAKAPYVQVSWHGMSMLLTTPALLYLLWPRTTSPLSTALWVTIAPIAILSLLYQNDGWVQFGFRFSIDYLFMLVMLLAIGGRPMTTTMKVVILVGIGVNLFGALTFGRAWQFYHEGFFPIGPNEF
ncbi:MAG: hypothetical protein ABI321_13720 [Polyangia bacterium]